ncbi:MAG: hypothetical protein R2769_09160 [Saprospiraceae bacterium]
MTGSRYGTYHENCRWSDGIPVVEDNAQAIGADCYFKDGKESETWKP